MNNFSKNLCGYLILPNSCSVATRDEWEKRSRKGEIIQTREARSGKIQRAYRANRKRHEDMKGQNSDLRVCPHLLDCVCQKREEDSGRNKKIYMNSTLGNVRFLDNSRHSQTNGPFHNHSKQTETLLATLHSFFFKKKRRPFLSSWRRNSYILPNWIQLPCSSFQVI